MSIKTPRQPRGAIAAVVTLASITALREQLVAQETQLAAQETAAREKMQNEITGVIDSIPGALAKVLGKESVTFAEVISYIKKRETGTLGKVGVKVGVNHGQHAKRLTEAEELTVKEAFIGRAVSEALGQPQKTVSAICNELNISGQTYDVRRKKYMADVAVTEEIARRAAAMKPAQVPALAAV